MDEAVVMDKSRVEGDAISIESDCGEFQVQSIVVPLIITDLGGRGRQDPLSYFLFRELTSSTPSSPEEDSRDVLSSTNSPFPAQGITSLSKTYQATNIVWKIPLSKSLKP